MPIGNRDLTGPRVVKSGLRLFYIFDRVADS